jgi:hypothetical protein
MIPTSLRHRAVSCHHYLQHPGHSCLKEMMGSMMYWKGMHTTIRRYVKSCDLAKSIRDTAKSMDTYHQTWS